MMHTNQIFQRRHESINLKQWFSTWGRPLLKVLNLTNYQVHGFRSNESITLQSETNFACQIRTFFGNSYFLSAVVMSTLQIEYVTKLLSSDLADVGLAVRSIIYNDKIVFRQKILVKLFICLDHYLSFQ